MSNRPKIEYETRFLKVNVLPRQGEPDAPPVERIRAQVRKIGEADWINIPSNYGSENEAHYAAQEWLNENAAPDADA
ncbi:hypothetical protein Herbaro_09185 [Herbaspirillum sp. WKF16]|uniref:hypothetical protein n=1 Tax=Herbaspirillum sp. WKF16 TaxID=3028312 RepID=UPI0023A9FADB|nr:hypothetical protein [Herbaspirillum sp. WKF16]WDZ97933.1 hypothetical protein Herbaro_09185 [Herbaspirillum sp. WKF16]